MACNALFHRDTRHPIPHVLTPTTRVVQNILSVDPISCLFTRFSLLRITKHLNRLILRRAYVKFIMPPQCCSHFSCFVCTSVPRLLVMHALHASTTTAGTTSDSMRLRRLPRPWSSAGCSRATASDPPHPDPPLLRFLAFVLSCSFSQVVTQKNFPCKHKKAKLNHPD